MLDLGKAYNTLRTSASSREVEYAFAAIEAGMKIYLASRTKSTAHCQSVLQEIRNSTASTLQEAVQAALSTAQRPVGISHVPRRRKWDSWIYHNGKTYHLGYCDSQAEAVANRRQAEADPLAAIERLMTKRETRKETVAVSQTAKGKWSARLRHRRKRYRLGLFDTRAEAIEARIRAEANPLSTIAQLRERKRRKNKGIATVSQNQ